MRALKSEIVIQLPESDKRSDDDIAHSVVNVLHWMNYLPDQCIRVEVEDGWITLSGQLEWESQRLAVRGAVRFLMGVRGVQDCMTVKTVSLQAMPGFRPELRSEGGSMTSHDLNRNIIPDATTQQDKENNQTNLEPSTQRNEGTALNPFAAVPANRRGSGHNPPFLPGSPARPTRRYAPVTR